MSKIEPGHPDGATGFLSIWRGQGVEQVEGTGRGVHSSGSRIHSSKLSATFGENQVCCQHADLSVRI